MYHDHGVLVSLLSALIMNKNMEAKTSRLHVDKKLIRYEQREGMCSYNHRQSIATYLSPFFQNDKFINNYLINEWLIVGLNHCWAVLIGVHGYPNGFQYDSHSENQLVSHLGITRFRTGGSHPSENQLLITESIFLKSRY